MWNALSFPERRFYQDMIRSLVSQFEEEDNNSICSEEHEGTFILDSEDEAFKVCYSIQQNNCSYLLQKTTQTLSA